MAATIKDTFKINSFIQNCFSSLNSIQKYNDDKIIITESVNLALIYDLNKLFCLKSFTFSSLLPLTSPLVYDSTTDQLIAVKNKTRLELINNEIECEEKKIIKLDKDQQIKCILTGDNCGSLIIFENNLICELDKLIKKESINFKEDCIELSLPTKTSKLEKLFIVPSEINNLRFWSLFIDDINDIKKYYYVLFNYNFILNELIIISKIELNNLDQFKLITFNSDNLLIISNDNKFKILNQTQEEFIFDLVLKDEEQLLDYGYLQLKDNISAITILTYNQNTNKNYLLAYDLNLKMEMKRIELNIQSEHQNLKLICLNSNIFIQTNSHLIYVPVQTEELSLADLIKTYKSELNLTNEKELTFDRMMQLLETNVKPIDKEQLLVEALEQFINKYKNELNLIDINNQINNELNNESNNNKEKINKLPLNLIEKLDKLFKYTFNSDFMIKQLKRKQFNRDYLISILELLNRALISCKSINCINWINVICDSYFICLNTSNNIQIINQLQNLKSQIDHLICKCKIEIDLKFLIDTLVLGLEDETTKYCKTKIIFPDNKHLGYKLEEIYL